MEAWPEKDVSCVANLCVHTVAGLTDLLLLARAHICAVLCHNKQTTTG